jgi:hypothetical protein
VNKSQSFTSLDLSIGFRHEPGGVMRVVVNAPSVQGQKVYADLRVTTPPGHETLNVVIPWNENEFQFTAKQNGLPTAGILRVGGREHVFEEKATFATLDYGRGVWPTDTRWNWGTGAVRQGKDVIGLNLGGQWTDGTGYTENGVCLNGVLHKIGEDVVFEYDKAAPEKPWTVRSKESDLVELEFTPQVHVESHVNFAVVRSDLDVVFGTWQGTVRLPGRPLKISNMVGWAEEHHARW